MSTTLLREWELMQQHLIPPLLEEEKRSGQARIWTVGSVADAVALAAAYQHARGQSLGNLRVFVSDDDREAGPVSFTLPEIRCIPRPSRAATFHRQDRRWVPDDQLAERVILARPGQPVDLVTLRREGTGDGLTDQAIHRLREGGHLLVVDEPGGLEGHEQLRSVDRRMRLFQKCAPATSARRATEDEAATLFEHQSQSELVTSHVRLARSLARRFSHHGEAKEDLEQVALLALVKAARRFDASRDISFSTYATASVLGELKRHFRDKTWMMRVPRSVQETYLAVKEAREALTQELSCSPTIQQIAGRLGVSDEAILEAMEAGENYWPESLDVGVFEGESSREVPVHDGAFDLTLDRQQFASLVHRLAPRERLILKRIYFDGWTQRQVADEVGVSQMQISRLLSRTIEKLQEASQE